MVVGIPRRFRSDAELSAYLARYTNQPIVLAVPRMAAGVELGWVIGGGLELLRRWNLGKSNLLKDAKVIYLQENPIENEAYAGRYIYTTYTMIIYIDCTGTIK